jgi:DNA-binding response OmpR family regulator
MNSPEVASSQAAQRTVLLVEDDELTRATTTDMLRACGCRVLEADRAENALMLLRDNDVSMLIADIGLPGESGLVFAARVRQMRPHLPIIFATGGDVRDDAPGGYGPIVLRKPYGIEALQAALDEALKR